MLNFQELQCKNIDLRYHYSNRGDAYAPKAPLLATGLSLMQHIISCSLQRTGFRNARIMIGVGIREIKAHKYDRYTTGGSAKYARKVTTVSPIMLMRLPVTRNSANFAIPLL